MLTLFTIPKPFRGHIGVIQRNAIRSWTLLRPACEVILFGDDEGTATAARDLGVSHVPAVARGEHGTPLVDDVFGQAQQLAKSDLLCYVNGDIILASDFLPAVARVAKRRHRFLIVGQRWDLDIKEPITFAAGWEESLRARLAREGALHPITGIDYFVFPCGLWGEIPPFAVGRTAWDNWLLYRARARGASLVDATSVILAVHQNHDYMHAGGSESAVWKGPEALRNQALAGGEQHIFTLRDATWLLTKRGLLPALTSWHLRRRGRVWLATHPRLRATLRVIRAQLTMPLRAALGQRSSHISRGEGKPR